MTRLTGGIRTELHFHILPGVDDGPTTLEESLELARLAVADGTRTIVCTPHAHQVDVATIPTRVRELQSELDAAGMPLRLVAGGEVSPGTDFSDSELRILAHGPPDRRWILLEAPLNDVGVDVFHAAADDLERRGYGLLIGHPERCRALVAPGGGLDARIRRGAVLQVNASSLTGAHGPRAHAAGVDLVRRGLVTAIASDAHRPSRPSRLTAALAVLRDQGIDGRALTDEWPARLLHSGIERALHAA